MGAWDALGRLDSSASAAVTEDERLDGLKQQTFLPIVLKARRCQARAQADVAAGERLSSQLADSSFLSSHGLSSVPSW